MPENPVERIPVTVLVLVTDSMSSRLVRGQLGFLCASGFRVHLGTAVAAGSAPTHENWHRLRSTLDTGVVPHHIPFVREPSPLRDIWSLIRTIAVIRRIHPDLIAVSTPKAGLIGMVAAWMCRVPVRVYTVRGFRFETMTGWRRRLFVLTEKVTITLAHHVLFNSESLRRVAEKHQVIAPGRGLVLGSGSGNGIDVESFTSGDLPSPDEARTRLGLPPRAKVIGFVGRLTADKGVNDLVDVFVEDLVSDSRLEAVAEPPILVLVGVQEEGDPLDAQTAFQIDSHPGIKHFGWIEDPRLVYPAFDVLAFPSYREGLPNVPLEAQMCGIPVVGYAATGTIDAVRSGRTGLLVEVGDRIGLADGLVTLLADEERRRRMGSAGRQWVSETFDQRRLWSDLADTYRRWLNQAD